LVLTPSTMLDLGSLAPDFSIPDVSAGRTVRRDDFKDKTGLLVMFICRHCPYVVHVQEELARIGWDYRGKSIGIVAISSNDAVHYPADSPDNLKAMALEQRFLFPVCYDESQAVAKTYTAACTPDFFLYDDSRKLVYRGQLDDSRPNSGKPVTGKDLREAMDAVLAGKTISTNQRPSTGCNIKWKPGKAPPYFGGQE
jgi:peroxiredoxin